MDSAKDFFDRAVAWFNQAQYDLAAGAAAQGLEIYADDGELWDIFGTMKWLLREPDEALNALETACSLKPLSPLGQLALGYLYEDQGKRELALVAFDGLSRSSRCPTSLLPDLARKLGQMGEHNMALEVCETLTDRDPACHQAHFGVAYYKAKLGYRASEFIPDLSHAMDLAPHVLSYRINLAWVWADAGCEARAYDLLKDVAPEKVCCAEGLRRMIKIFGRFGDFDRCWTCLQALESREPNELRNAANRGREPLGGWPPQVDEG